LLPVIKTYFGERDGSDAGLRGNLVADPPHHFAPEVIAVERGIHRERQNPVGLEAGVDGAEIRETPNEKTRSDEKEQRQRHLRHDQSLRRIGKIKAGERAGERQNGIWGGVRTRCWSNLS
jgi:hypothetical protein